MNNHQAAINLLELIKHEFSSADQDSLIYAIETVLDGRDKQVAEWLRDEFVETMQTCEDCEKEDPEEYTEPQYRICDLRCMMANNINGVINKIGYSININNDVIALRKVNDVEGVI